MGLFKKKVVYATLELNARLQPFDRGEYFEKPMDQAVKSAKLGRVDGGGTLLSEEGEPERSDVNFDVYVGKEHDFIEFIKRGVKLIPIGSRVVIDGSDTAYDVGHAEGLGLYLNGTELPAEVYQTCSINVVLEELMKDLGDSVYYFSHYRGNKETALYFYGTSFDVMNERIAQFVGSYPLCRKSRIERIA